MNGINQFQWASGMVAFCLTCLAGCQVGEEFPNGPVVSLGQDKSEIRHPLPPAVEKQWNLGQVLEKRGDLDHAAVAYRNVLKYQPHRADASWRLAILCVQQGKWKEADLLFRKALAANPGNPDLYCDMGYSLYLQRHWAEAEMNLRQALVLARDHRRAHVNLGLLMARTDRVAEALVEFRTAKLDVADAQVNVAFALTLDRRWDEAKQHYDKALAADPHSDAARLGSRQLARMTEIARGKKTADQPPEETLLQFADSSETPAVEVEEPQLPDRNSGP